MDLKPQNESEVGADPPPGGSRCWCGGADLEPLRVDFASCRECGTVLYSEPYDPAEYAATDAVGFYGDHYWRWHVPDRLGLPGLEERARADLPERAVCYLRKILRHVAPGARVLDLGCGSGSLTYLLRQAGFDAIGLELGPAAIEHARRRFGVEVIQGPLERAELEGSFDAIVAIDLLEHLPRPRATLELCAGRLKADGTLFIQTPRYRDQGSGWEMLIPREHLFLFTAASVERLLRAVGFATVETSDSLFPYDMWVAAARGPLAPRPDPAAGLPPIVLALIDAHDEAVRARDELAAVDADRRSKERGRQSLSRELASARADQQAKEELIRRQDEERRALRQDQEAKERLIDRLSEELSEVRRDQTAKGELIDRLSARLATAQEQLAREGERAARLAGELEQVRADAAAKGALIDRLTAELEEVRRDQGARGELIDRLSGELAAVRADQQAKEGVIATLDAELSRHRAELEDIRSDRLYQGLRVVRDRFGRRSS